MYGHALTAQPYWITPTQPPPARTDSWCTAPLICRSLAEHFRASRSPRFHTNSPACLTCWFRSQCPTPSSGREGGEDERGQGMHGCRVPCPDPIIREMGEEAPHHLQGGLPGLSACSYIHPFFPSSLFFTTTLFILPAGRTPTLVRRPRTSHIHTSATALCPSSSSYPICTTLQRSVWSDMNVVHTHCIVV